MAQIFSENVMYYYFFVGILFFLLSFLLKSHENNHIRFFSFIIFSISIYRILEAFNIDSKSLLSLRDFIVFTSINLNFYYVFYFQKTNIKRNIFIVFFVMFSFFYLISESFWNTISQNFIFITCVLILINMVLPFILKKVKKTGSDKYIYLFFILISIGSIFRLNVNISSIFIFYILFISSGLILLILKNISLKDSDNSKSNIIWIFFLSGIFILFLLSVFIINVSEKFAENKLKEDAAFKSREISKVLNDNLEIYIKGVRLLSEENAIIDFLEKKEEKEYTNSNNVVDRFLDVLEASLVYILDRNGDTVVSSNRDSINSILGENYSFRDYFKNAMEGVITYYFAVGVTTGERGFYTSFPIKSDGELKGVAVIKKNLDVVENVLPNENPVFIINHSGVILMSNSKKHILKTLNKIDEFEFNEIKKTRQFEGLQNVSVFNNRRNESVEFEGKNYYSNSTDLKYANWKVIFLVEDNLVSNYRNFSFVFIITLFLILIILFDFLRREYLYLKTVVGSEKKYRTLFENSPNMIGILDKKFRFLEINRKFSWVSGLTDGEFLGIDLFTFWKKIDENEKQNVKDKVLSGKIFIREIIFKPFDNNYDKQILVMISPIDNENIIFIGVDVTEERRMERELYEEQERIIVTINSIEEGVINTDKKGNILVINKIAQEITQLKGDISIGQNIRICNIRFNNNEYNPISKVLKSEKNLRISKYITVGPENIPVYLNVAPTFDNSGRVNGGVLAFRDIRNEKKIEEEMINLQKLESIGLFAAGIAHDFNNILTSVLGNISIVEKNINKDNKVYQNLKNSENACMNAKDLTMQLLTFAKREAPDKELVDLKKILRETAEFSVRGTNNRLVLDIEDRLWNIEAESGKIKQVINNVIVNACQAMSNGGTVYLGATNETLFELSGHSGNFVKISIKDTGVGIKKEDISRIYDPYFTTKKDGTGLGLASVLAIVKNHDGFIQVFSEKNEGTRFDIFLPASIDGELNQNNEEGENILVSGKGKVLIMDDEEDVREVIGYMLEEMGYNIAACKKGEEVIERYRKGERYLFIIMDLTIKGGLGGVETMKELLEIDKDVKVIVASGYSHNIISEDFRKHGFSAVVSKPFTLNQLSDAIKSLEI